MVIVLARLVMKFGGSSVADGIRLRHCAELIKKYYDDGDEVIVVTSALAGITDLLIGVAGEAAGDGKLSHVKEFAADLIKRHHDAAHDAIDDEDIIEEVVAEVDARVDELEKVLVGICYLGELTNRSMDYIMSFGERLAAPILSGSLRSMGVPSCSLTGGEAGLITDSNYQNARPLMDVEDRMQGVLEPLLSSCVPVIAGFIGMDERGVITTLGRGGSDYSASLAGAAVEADEIWLWKEIDGIMTTDPKVVPEAKSIPTISYIEAMELSFFGAKVLHPRAIEPAIRRGIPVRVKNTFNPDFPGTSVLRDEEAVTDVVKAVTVVNHVSLINVGGAGMVGTPGVAAKVFGVMANHGINVIMISQGSSEANISFVVDAGDRDKACEALRAELRNDIVKEVTCTDDVCVVAVVGAGMAGTPGVAGKVFTSMGDNGVNVIMISQGSSEHNISFVVSKEDAQKACQVLHKSFQLDKEHSK